MCGIVAYLGSDTKAKKLISVLKKLEYRGYDSSGFSSLKNHELKAVKSVGSIKNLEDITPDEIEVSCFISHTRWATHGKPSEINSHPHISAKGNWAVVHNGIIENFDKLKECLNTKPQSQTDTAVVSQILEEQNVQDIFGFIKVCNGLEGSFGMACQNKNYNDKLFLAKRKSPLYLSKNKKNDVLVASDPICFVGFSSEYYSFSDDEFAEVCGGDVAFYNKNGEIITKSHLVLDDIFFECEKSDYPHYMIKEINEQKQALKRQVSTYKQNEIFAKFDGSFIQKFNKVVFVGCGTAYHAGLVGAKFFSTQTNIFSTCEVASEFIYSSPVFADEKTLFVLVSQSGETADTLLALEIAKKHGSTTIALTNVLYSSLASKCDYILPVCAGPEIAVASTKAYVCQLSAIYMFASHIKNVITGDNNDYYDEIDMVSDEILNFDKNKIEKLAKKIVEKNDAIFIGKNIDYITALESSLKLKEVGYIPSACYPSGELKHGFLALVESGTPLVVIAGHFKTASKTFNAMHEAVSRGAEATVITNQNCENFENVIQINCKNEMLFAMLSIVPLQYLAYIVSVAKNINPDQPRNLAKSVTVE